MKYCKECKINVDTERLTCPLCCSVLEEKDDQVNSVNYPPHPHKKGKNNLFYKVIVFLCLSSSLITFLINLIIHEKGGTWWCLYVILSMFYIYMLVRRAILTHSYVVKRLFIQLLTASIIVYGFDRLSGDVRWASGYVIPLLAIANNITIVIITLANKKSYSEGFNCTLLSLLFGLVPFIIQLCGWINIENLWAPLVSFCASIVIFLGMLVFANSATKEEFKKRFHL